MLEGEQASTHQNEKKRAVREESRRGQTTKRRGNAYVIPMDRVRGRCVFIFALRSPIHYKTQEGEKGVGGGGAPDLEVKNERR